MSDSSFHEQEPCLITPSERKLGRYLLSYELASGGMATVFLARAEGPRGYEKLVALKRIHPYLAKRKSFVAMFLDEARIAARIRHTNVCNVFDYGESEGIHYLAMEYLLGEPLSKVIRALRTCEDETMHHQLPAIALKVVADFAEGLHAAHELRDENNDPLEVVHRDVSPPNLFITYDGVAKIVDFGIATARERLHETETGQIKGKYAYMSPEQASAGIVDRRTDIWALGVVLWELLTLKPLFRRKSDSETLFSVMSAPIERPSSLRQDLTPRIDEIILKALEREPDRRYASARELAGDLTQALAEFSPPIGLVEISDWMNRLLANERTRKQELIDFTRNMSASGSTPESSSTEKITTVDETASRPVASWKKGALWIALPLLAIVTIGGVLLIWLWPEEPTGPSYDPHLISSTTTTPVAPEGETNDDRRSSEPPQDAAPQPPKSLKRRTTGRPSATRTGRVAVSTTVGWADVYWQRRRLGQTPHRFEIPLGRQVLEVRPYGKRPSKRIPVVVRSDRIARVVVKLEPRSD